MGEFTQIEWCDSTLNLQMGCDGCELWNPKAGIRHCYAGTLTERYGGKNGWPASFGQPALFPHRLTAALKWPDLTGTERPEKPWLNGRPRIIFLDDMGDTFTESLPLDWLAEHLPLMAASPHVWMVLTKRPHRMRRFFEQHPCPPNVWPGTSATDQPTANARVRELLQIRAEVLWVSAEPLLAAMDLTDVGGKHVQHDALTGEYLDARLKTSTPRLSLVIVGGESGPGARPCDLHWIRSLVEQCGRAGVAAFVKQLGARPVSSCREDTGSTGPGAASGTRPVPLRDRKGGTMEEWPADLRVRQFPEVRQ